ncbi:hypothetical protein BDZ45DRAFT_452700 [Acephala macrosclerotiorum]|nr:hypothetical protein BDZ45DRAFT_452700 [Acephala macrosclerotiorum]
MEQYGRRERAADEHQARPKGSREDPSSSRHHKYHNPSNEASRKHKEVPTPESHRDGAHAKRPKETPVGPLNGDDDYVRRWLAQTDSLTNQDPELLRRRETASRYEDEEKTHITHVKPKYRLDPQETEEALPPIRKRKHASSSDSSILAVPIRPKSQRVDRGEEEARTRKSWEKTRDSTYKKQRIESSESNSSDPFTDESPPRETFEKRARHKTREDKYEPKIGCEKTKRDAPKRKSKRKEKKSDRRKAAKKSGKELMQNFNSKSIGQERLTVRPTQGLGLFNNGRASSPARRRGLSDLAFSEMNFLQHSNRHPQVEQKPKASSKAREKEKRKASRAQEEITEFFRPSRNPLEETHPNEDRRRASFSKPTEKRSVYVKQVEQENRQQSHDDIKSLEPRQRPYVGLRHSASSSERLSTYHSVSPAILDPRKYHESASRASEKGTTYVSWSETQLSPSASSQRLTIVDHRPVSPTPESVWRSIENTGIFRDTGIKMSSAMVRRNERPSSRLDRTKTSSASESARYSQVRSSTSPRRLSPEVEHNHRLDPRSQDERPASAASRGRTRTPLAESLQLPRNPGAAENLQNLQEIGNVRRRTVIEYFDSEHGWHETSNPLGRCKSRTSDPPRESVSTPIDRQELAKAARIKRPSTTLPLSRIHAEEREPKQSREHADQRTIGMAQSGGREHKASMSVDKIVLPLENETTGDGKHHTNLEQSRGKGNVSQQFNSENSEGLASKSGHETQEFGKKCESLGPRTTQQDSAVTKAREMNFVQNISSLTYMGLPLRGSWHPEGQYQSPIVSNRQPHFLHQLQQVALKHFDTIPEYTAITQYELYDIPEEEEAVPMQEGCEDYGYHEANIAEDPVDGHYFYNLEDVGVENIDHGNVDQLGMEYYPAHGIYDEPEDYQLQNGGGQEEIYEDDAIVEDEFMEQGLKMPFQPEEQKSYAFHDFRQHGHMEEL